MANESRGLHRQRSDLVAKRMIAAETDGEGPAEQERMRAQRCADAARTGDFYTVNSGLCRNDKAAVKTFCANFQTHTVFRKIAEEQARNVRSGASAGGQVQPLTSSASLCGVDADKTRDRLCGTAEAQGQYAFIATQCLALAGAIGKRECSGPRYVPRTDPRYLPICAALAGKAEDAVTGRPDERARQCHTRSRVPTQEKKKPGLFNKARRPSTACSTADGICPGQRRMHGRRGCCAATIALVSPRQRCSVSRQAADSQTLPDPFRVRRVPTC